MADQTLDDFLGVKPQPRWRKWVQWGVVVIGVVALPGIEGSTVPSPIP